MAKQKILFYIFIVILVVTRIIAIIDTVYLREQIEKEILFISSSIYDGVPPLPSIFQVNASQAGGGNLIYSLLSVPFLWLFGKSYFSVRLASIIFLILIYSLTYKFCNKYFGLKTAIFGSLLFIISSELVTGFSVTAEGRHFHLNIFFILCLYLFSRIKETKKTIYYLLFGLACGLGIYFYPAFLVTVFVFGLFLLWDIDFSEPSFIYKYLIAIIWIIIAGNFLLFKSPWYSTYYELVNGNVPKNLHTSGNISSVLSRFIINFFWKTPNGLLFSSSCWGVNAACNKDALRQFFLNLTTLSGCYLEAIRLIFIVSFISLGWLNRIYLKKIIHNGLFVKKRYDTPMSAYITIFLLVHVFIFLLLFSFNEGDHCKYFLPLLLSIILIIAIFLSEMWQRNKYLSLSLLFFILLPGAKYQFHNFKIVSLKDFYKHYIYFYDRDDVNRYDAIARKDISAHRLICDKLNINVCYTVGSNYIQQESDYIHNAFKYISGGELNKLNYLYQGLIYAKLREEFSYSNGDFRKIVFQIENINPEYRNFCYIGLGEFISGEKTDFPLSFEENKKIIEEVIILIKEDYKKYFFQGLGEGLAKRFAIPYSPYITEGKLCDDKILDSYTNLINNKEYKDAFLAGFFNKDIWSGF